MKFRQPSVIGGCGSRNRDIMLSLNREIGLDLTKGSTPDRQVRAATGTLDLSGDWIFGLQVGGAYDAKWRTTNRTSRNFSAKRTV